jgi:hypothetical protein
MPEERPDRYSTASLVSSKYASSMVARWVLTPADPSGVSMFRARETRPGPGALYTPGTAVPARPRMRPVAAACRLAAAGPCHPGPTTRIDTPVKPLIAGGGFWLRADGA